MSSNLLFNNIYEYSTKVSVIFSFRQVAIMVVTLSDSEKSVRQLQKWVELAIIYNQSWSRKLTQLIKEKNDMDELNKTPVAGRKRSRSISKDRIIRGTKLFCHEM